MHSNIEICYIVYSKTYLIIYRVADGTAWTWTKNPMDSAALTTMNFNTRNGTEANKKNQRRGGPAATSRWS